MNRQVLAASASAGGALVLVGAFAGGYAIAHDHVLTHVIIKTVTPPPVTRTRVRVVIRSATPRAVARPAASPSPSAAVTASTISFACKVEQTGGGGEVYEVTADSGAAYSGTVEISFYGPAGSGQTFPPAWLPGTAPGGSAANWHAVPPSDIGASAEPIGCIGQAAG